MRKSDVAIRLSFVHFVCFPSFCIAQSVFFSVFSSEFHFLQLRISAKLESFVALVDLEKSQPCFYFFHLDACNSELCQKQSSIFPRSKIVPLAF